VERASLFMLADEVQCLLLSGMRSSQEDSKFQEPRTKGFIGTVTKFEITPPSSDTCIP